MAKLSKRVEKINGLVDRTKTYELKQRSGLYTEKGAVGDSIGGREFGFVWRPNPSLLQGERTIAFGVAQLVVDLFEVVEIEIHDRDARGLPAVRVLTGERGPRSAELVADAPALLAAKHGAGC